MNNSTAGPGGKAVLVDLTLIIGVLLISKAVFLRVDALWAYAGPISLLLTLGVATWRLRLHGQTWADQGLSKPGSFTRLAVQTLIALVVTIAAGMIAQSLAVGLIGGPDDATQAISTRYQGRFDNLPGNLPVYLFWLSMAWIVGGFTEEMLFRGVLFTRFERLLSRLPLSAVLAIVCQAVLFGQQHFYYQGLAGWVATGAIALVSGVLYLLFQRNLWPLVLSHGLSNTLGLTLLYAGVSL